MMPKHSHSMTNVKFTTMPIRAGKETQVNGRWKGCLSLGFFEFEGGGADGYRTAVEVGTDDSSN